MVRKKLMSLPPPIRDRISSRGKEAADGRHKGREARHEAGCTRSHEGDKLGQRTRWYRGGARHRIHRRDRGRASADQVLCPEINGHQPREEEPDRPEQPEPTAGIAGETRVARSGRRRASEHGTWKAKGTEGKAAWPSTLLAA